MQENSMVWFADVGEYCRNKMGYNRHVAHSRWCCAAAVWETRKVKRQTTGTIKIWCHSGISRSPLRRQIVPSQSQAWAHSGFARRRCTSRCISRLNENREGTRIAGNRPLASFRLVQQVYLYSCGCWCTHPGIAGELQREWFREGEHRERKFFGARINSILTKCLQEYFITSSWPYSKPIVFIESTLF